MAFFRYFQWSEWLEGEGKGLWINAPLRTPSFCRSNYLEISWEQAAR